MNIGFTTLDHCQSASGIVVVIDVCRAFTSAAYAFGGGAERILLAGMVDQALKLRERFPGALIMGEVDGLPVPGFDLWNSPGQLTKANLSGKTLIQRTSAGTQGVVRAVQAEHLFVSSFALAQATVQAIMNRPERPVTFVITGAAPDDPRFGLEDRACAEYMAAMLRGESADWRNYMGWEADFRAVHQINTLPEPLRSQFNADLGLCQQANRFPWALVVRREDNLLILEREETRQ